MRLFRPFLILAALELFALGALRAAQPQPPAAYPCNELGYVRHWLVVGPARLPYTGPEGSDTVKREKGVDQAVAIPPAQAALGAPGPLGEPWRFYDPGENFFVECTAFYHNLARLDYYAFTDLHAQRDGAFKANLWAAGLADLWVDGAHVLRQFSPRDPVAQPFSLPLKKGVNRVCVRLQCVGIRDTNMLFGLQLIDGAGAVRAAPPGPDPAMRQIHGAIEWLWGVKPAGRDALVSALPAPAAARVEVKGGRDVAWSRGQRRVAFTPADAAQVTVTLAVAGQRLARVFEIPANRPPAPRADPNPERNRKNILALIAQGKDGRIKDVYQVLARRVLGLERSPAETTAIEETLLGIQARKDCSDFTLAVLFRLQLLGLTSPAENEKIKRVALDFRYWTDEPGNDAMCFTSENHALLFHTCQMIAGQLYPTEIFSNTRRTGAQQEALGLQRIMQWLDKTERNGYNEFLSSTYMPLTVGAMLNAVDFSGDPEIARRASALTDRLLRDLATMAFDRVTVAPQGRVYRNILYPRDCGTQALLAYATPAALISTNNWVSFLASSKNYKPPAGLDEIMARPAGKVYREDVVEIAVEKTPAFLLTSLQIPASFAGVGKLKKPVGLIPGEKGYQQHLWHATLGRDCHVFVNNPGGSFDMSAHRPGYWYGNTTLPRLVQKKGMLFEIFDLPETNPMPFTHAHWPADAFDRQQVRGRWAFGALGDGAIALWCAAELRPHDEVLTGRELRALGRRAAWLCVCGSLKERGGFEGFVKYCEALAPSFDETTLTLQAGGEKVAFK